MRTRRTSLRDAAPPSMAVSAPLTNGITPHGAKVDPKSAEKALSQTQSQPPALNVQDVVLGSLLIKPWFSSEGYPEELVGKNVDRLYVCQWCFKYTKELVPFLQHLKTCPLRAAPPPGTPIYTKGRLSIHLLDGSSAKLYAQNLSLFAKFFLHVKSVFYDVSAFLFYLLVLDDDDAPEDTAVPITPLPDDNTTAGTDSKSTRKHVIGFFSKEKLSWDAHNLACLCVFPPWQQRGYAQLLIAASYVLGRREGRLGGPERPLSSHGYAAYMRYWTQTLARTIVGWPEKKVTVGELGEETGIAVEDCWVALGEMGVLEGAKKGKGCVVNRGKVRVWAEVKGVRLESPVDEEAFVVEDDDDEMEDEESEEEEE